MAEQSRAAEDEFVIGQVYARAEISEEIGGGHVAGLPRSDGRVVAACLRKSENPDAPYVIPVSKNQGGSGNLEERGEQLSSQRGESIPVFFRAASAEWRYLGLSEVVGDTTVSDICHRYYEASGRGRKVARLIYLRPTEKGLSVPARLRAFAENDKAFFKWMEHHPGGFVLNVKGAGASRPATIHKSGCSHISPSEGDQTWDYTEGDAIKVCAEDPRPLRECLEIERPELTGDIDICNSCAPPAGHFPKTLGSDEERDRSSRTGQSLGREILRRRATWERLRERGGPHGVRAGLLRELRIYRGQAGIWTDKDQTAGAVCGEGRVAVSVLHTGEHYPDGLSDGHLVYQYPETDRPGKTDANEIDAVKNASMVAAPIFVVLKNEEDPDLRDVYWGRVEDWNDEAGEFLIRFGPSQGPFERKESEGETASSEEEFDLVGDRTDSTQERPARPEQPRFRFRVRKRYGLRCAVCDMEIPKLLEAAHIRDRSENGTNDPRNGLLLCRNHHKAFDDGLFGVNPDTSEIYLPRGGPPAEKLGIGCSHLDPKRNEPHPEALQWAWYQWRESLDDEEAIRPVG